MVWLDVLFALRPLVLVPAWSFFLLGSAASPQPGLPAARLLQLTLILLATHLVNQVVDVETDRLNDKGFFLQRGIFRRSQYVALAALLLILALVSVLWRRDAMLELGLAAFLGMAYSLPPLRLSRRPFVDLAANALGYGGIAFLLGRDAPVRGLGDAAQVLACMLAVATVFLHTTLLDRDGDRRDGKNTTGVLLGTRRTVNLARLAATLALAAALLSRTPLLVGACLVLVPLSLWAPSRRVCVGGTAAFAAAASVGFWWFAVVLLLLLVVTRRYYRWRFARRYPAL